MARLWRPAILAGPGHHLAPEFPFRHRRL